MNPFFLMSPQAAREYGLKGPAGNTLEALESASFDLLVSKGTGVIVPQHILDKAKCAVNIHGGPPSYPGRDPHHWAAYDGATEYGATLHYMIAKVDAGPIIDVELFPVPAGCPPSTLLGLADKAGQKLLHRFLDRYEREGPPPATSIQWGKRRTTRAHFLELCRITPDMPEPEFNRRLHATSFPGYNNLFMEMHGKRWKIAP
jgi:methionyl-tRNA formyltransferase